MFSPKREVTAREIESAHAQLLALLAERDQWYDGSVHSVDRRLASVARTLTSVRHIAATDSAMLAEAVKLEDEYRRLSALRREALDGGQRTLPKSSSNGPLSARGRRLIATEVPQFLADNADAVDDVNEMDARAQDHAEIVTMQMPVTEARSVVAHFRIAVNWQLRNQQSRRVALRRTANTALAFDAAAVPDAAMFD